MEEPKKRLNIPIDMEIHKQLKLIAIEKGITLTELIREALNEKVNRERKG